METLQFMFKDFWHFAGSLILLSTVLYFAVNGCLKLWSRLLRALMVSLKGWPPQHLDADGDFKQNEKEDILS
jgi:hypothetical protein